MSDYIGRINGFYRGGSERIEAAYQWAITDRTITAARLVVREDPDDSVSAALIDKTITTTDVPGTGYVSQDGQNKGVIKVRFDLLPQDTLKFQADLNYFYNILVTDSANEPHVLEAGLIRANQGLF